MGNARIDQQQDPGRSHQRDGRPRLRRPTTFQVYIEEAEPDGERRNHDQPSPVAGGSADLPNRHDPGVDAPEQAEDDIVNEPANQRRLAVE